MSRESSAMILAPCGLLCDLCLGYQRKKNRCVGCLADGNKPNHCATCSIKTCPEKRGDPTALCSACAKYPCRRIKDLDKRYKTKYAESILENFKTIAEIGMDGFMESSRARYACAACGVLLCVHAETCQACGAPSALSHMG